MSATRRVEVRFRVASTAEVKVEYAATAEEAEHFAAAMVSLGNVVIVDAKVRDGLQPLPCRALWRYD